jgi:hypothetical protein
MQQAKRNFVCCRILFSHFLKYLLTVIMEQGIVWKCVAVVFACFYSYKSKVLLKFAFL